MGWNGSDRRGAAAPQKPKVTPKMPSPVRGLVAGAAVVVLGVAAYFLFFAGDGQIAKVKNGKSGRIQEVKPAASRKAPVDVEQRTAVGAKREQPQKKRAAEEYGPTDVVVNLDAPVANPTNPPTKRVVFNNRLDQLLAMVMPNEPGDKVPPLPISENEEFSEEEEKYLLERLTAKDDDSDYELERKELVQNMRDEYADLKKRGWKFVDYLRALDAKVRLDAEVKDESYKMHSTIFSDRTISDEKYTEMLGKINKVLTDRGIKPIDPKDFADEDGEAADANPSAGNEHGAAQQPEQ